MYIGSVTSLPARVHALCIGRHPYLAEHLARCFERLGITTSAAVGLAHGLRAARARTPSVVVCEYDVLATQPLDAWEREASLGSVPVFGVSLTRRPDEVNLLDVNGIAGFLYLPTLKPDDARRVLGIPRPRVSYSLPSPFASGPRAESAPPGW